MIMQIKFGYTFDDKRKLVKNVTWNNTFQCKPYADYNITSPILIIANATGAISNNNYAFIADYNRYYFVDSVSVGRNGMYVVKLSVDVLMTYANGIKNLNCIISRQENAGINDIIDDKLPILNNKKLSVIEFSQSDFNIESASTGTYNFVLNVAGGGGGQTNGNQ